MLLDSFHLQVKWITNPQWAPNSFSAHKVDTGKTLENTYIFCFNWISSMDNSKQNIQLHCQLPTALILADPPFILTQEVEKHVFLLVPT